MPELTLQEELADLTARIEKILHDELPEAVRNATQQGGTDFGTFEPAVEVLHELDDVQRALGLKTYELLRGQPQALGPVLRRLAPQGIGSSPEAPGPDLVGDATLPDPVDYDPGEKGEAATVVCYRCRSPRGVTSCPDCAKPFCPDHVDPALHPCGDLL